MGRQFFPGHPLGEIQQHIVLQQLYRLHCGGLFTLLCVQVDEGIGFFVIHPTRDGRRFAHQGHQPQKDILGLAQWGVRNFTFP